MQTAFLLFVLSGKLLLSSVIAASDDFGSQIVTEAVDLSAAQELADGAGAEDLEGLLHWAISHSDTEELRKRAESVMQEEAVNTFLERQKRVKELVDYMNSQATETDLVREALSIISAVNSTEREKLYALEDLQTLVEPIDNANDLRNLGAIEVITSMLRSNSSELVAASAHVFGAAASNNVKFQTDLLEVVPDIYMTLLQVMASDNATVAAKGLYALSSCVRNSQEQRQHFYAAGGIAAVEGILKTASSSLTVKKKTLNLVMDLLQEDTGLAKQGLFEGLPETIVSLLRYNNLDVQEKSLMAIQTIATDPLVLKKLQLLGVEGAIRSLLQTLSTSSEYEDQYGLYLSSLCNRVLQLVTSRHKDEL